MSSVLTVRVPPPLISRLDRKAAALGRTRAEHVRQVLEADLAARNPKSKAFACLSLKGRYALGHGSNNAAVRKDRHHQWATRIFESESPPFYTAEPILAEASAVIGTAADILKMLETGDLVIALELGQEASAVRALILAYKNRPMDLGDACCVRLAELISGSVVYTVDKSDFSIYRKHRRQPVPCIFPD